MEVFIAVVDDVALRSTCPNKTYTLKRTTNNLHEHMLEFLFFFYHFCLRSKHLGVGSKLHSFLSGDTIAGVEDSRSGYGPKQG